MHFYKIYSPMSLLSTERALKKQSGNLTLRYEIAVCSSAEPRIPTRCTAHSIARVVVPFYHYNSFVASWNCLSVVNVPDDAYMRSRIGSSLVHLMVSRLSDVKQLSNADSMPIVRLSANFGKIWIRTIKTHACSVNDEDSALPRAKTVRVWGL